MSPPSPSPLPSPSDNNTFTTICAVSGALVRRHRGEVGAEQQIIEQVKEEIQTHHATGNTATHPTLLHRKVRQVVQRHLRTYRRPRRSEAETSKAERAFQNALDATGVEDLMRVTAHELAGALRDLGASGETLQFMMRWLDAAKKQNGRVAVKRRSQGGEGITMVELAGSERRYRLMLKEIEDLGLWKTVCPHSRGLKKCRLMALSAHVLDQVAVYRKSEAKHSTPPE